MAIEHVNIPDAQRHEPKGASTASNGTVYVSNGSGSGTWKAAPYTYSLVTTLPDISTASSCHVVVPVSGTLTRVYTVIDGAIATDDATLTFEINGAPVPTASITVGESGSAAGDVDSSAPSSGNSVSAGNRITMTTDGASTNTVRCTVTYLISVS